MSSKSAHAEPHVGPQASTPANYVRHALGVHHEHIQGKKHHDITCCMAFCSAGYTFWLAATEEGGLYTCDTQDDGYAGTLPEKRKSNNAGQLGRSGELAHGRLQRLLLALPQYTLLCRLGLLAAGLKALHCLTAGCARVRKHGAPACGMSAVVLVVAKSPWDQAAHHLLLGCWLCR